MTAAEGGGLGAVAALEVTLGKLAEKIDQMTGQPDQPDRLDNLWQHLRVVPVWLSPITGASGTSDQPDRTGPHDGFWWDMRRLECWGFTAGSVAVTLNDVNGELIAAFPQAGQFTWSGQLFLAPRDRLIAVSTGITGSVFIQGQAVEISTQLMPDYLL